MDDANVGGTTAGSAIQLADVGIAGFSPSAKTPDIAAAPADSCPINILLWYLKDRYSSGDTSETLFYS